MSIRILALLALATILISGCVTAPSKRYNGPGSPTIHFSGEGDGGSGGGDDGDGGSGDSGGAGGSGR